MYETSKTTKTIRSNKKLIDALDKEYLFILDKMGTMSIEEFSAKTGISVAYLTNFLNNRPNLFPRQVFIRIYNVYGIRADNILNLETISSKSFPACDPRLNTAEKRLYLITKTIGRELRELRYAIGIDDILSDRTKTFSPSAAYLIASKYHISLDWMLDTAEIYSPTNLNNPYNNKGEN